MNRVYQPETSLAPPGMLDHDRLVSARVTKRPGVIEGCNLVVRLQIPSLDPAHHQPGNRAFRSGPRFS
jgi:hypothetical protein